ncbi:MAG: NUDIX domain-containing protein [Hyphomicrobium sp.]|uniref:NUDIX domain-containing protein n=1 Tax=Hyphomicrobium sp. TaxID=82 RepID=UPI003D0D848F
MTFPVSVKGVLFDRDRVLLLGNERAEWELPGGRLEAGETIAQCLAREGEEALGIGVEIGPLLDCRIYEGLPGLSVLIRDAGAVSVSTHGPRSVPPNIGRSTASRSRQSKGCRCRKAIGVRSAAGRRCGTWATA